MNRTLSALIALCLVLPPLAVSQQEKQLTFSHKKHVQEGGVACVDCHANAVENNGGGRTNHPSMETCKQCHEEAMTEKNCAMCHPDPATQKPFVVSLHHKNFSHKDHLKREVRCQFCHKGVEQAALATEKNLPGMDVCLTCHNDKSAPRNCNLCHTDPGKKRPAAHSRPDFQDKGHGRDARFAKLECDKCHAESFCDRCHKGLDKRPIHKPNFEFYHGVEAKKRDRNCATCHESEAFCAACHAGRKR